MKLFPIFDRIENKHGVTILYVRNSLPFSVGWLSMHEFVEYLIIGAGPAAVCAIAKLYGSGVSGTQIIWIDPQFKVGDFGTKLSIGSSVPGNTTVESYQKVNHEIYTLIPECAPTAEEQNQFELTSLSPETTCSLKIAAQPLHHITQQLRRVVHSIEGRVLALHETKDGLGVDIKLKEGTLHYIVSKRVILATGSEPRTMPLPDHITLIDPYCAFIESELKPYLNEHLKHGRVAVIGSSHSAALATMHLIQAKIEVKQFMNKEYKFAVPAIASDGRRYTQFDNTGLKGEVARFTQELLNNSSLRTLWECHIGKDIDTLLATHLSGCSHAVLCIGYTSSSTLKINGLSLAHFKYDKQSTRIIHPNGHPVSGLFGIGIAFPPEVKAISGEIEYAVGVGKFWDSLNDGILSEWNNSPWDQPCAEVMILSK